MDSNKKKLTGRERRMQHFKQMQGGAGMNLVSLMDIFTILVFFLLANSSSQQLPSSREVRLPVSIATKVPGENLVITVSKDSILVQGKKVAAVQEVMQEKEPLIALLGNELKNVSHKRFQIGSGLRRLGRPVLGTPIWFHVNLS